MIANVKWKKAINQLASLLAIKSTTTTETIAIGRNIPPWELALTGPGEKRIPPTEPIIQVTKKPMLDGIARMDLFLKRMAIQKPYTNIVIGKVSAKYIIIE